MDLVIQNIQVFEGSKALTPAFTYTFRRGFMYVLSGPSGIGKSLFLQAVAQVLPDNLFFKGDISISSNDIVYVFQDASSSLNPLKSIGDSLSDLMRFRKSSKNLELYLTRLNIQDSLLVKFPFQLSGGQKQRVNILLALLSGKDWIFFDEVNSGLDDDNTRLLLNIIKSEISEYNRSVLWVTHFNQDIIDQADFILKVVDNQINEVNNLEYSKKSLSIINKSRTKDIILIENGEFSYSDGRFKLGPIHWSIESGEKVLITGESGSGKSSLSKMLFGKISLDRGKIQYPLLKDSEKLSSKIQWVFQESYDSFAPHIPLWISITDPAVYSGKLSNGNRKEEAKVWCEKFKLPVDILSRNAQECSGGQRQRLNIIRALMCKPELLICDEITANLNPELALSILHVLYDCQKEMGFALIYITHRPDEIPFAFHTHYEMRMGRMIKVAPQDQ